MKEEEQIVISGIRVKNGLLRFYESKSAAWEDIRVPAVTKISESNVSHIKDVYSLMYDRTGIAIPEVETMISDIS